MTNEPAPRERAVVALEECGYTEEQALEMLAAIKQEVEADDYREDIAEQIG